MSFGLLVKNSDDSVAIDSTVRFTRFKGVHSITIGAGDGVVAYGTPPKYVQGDIVIPMTSTAPFLEVEYEASRIKFINTLNNAGTVTYMLLGFL